MGPLKNRLTILKISIKSALLRLSSKDRSPNFEVVHRKASFLSLLVGWLVGWLLGT